MRRGFGLFVQNLSQSLKLSFPPRLSRGGERREKCCLVWFLFCVIIVFLSFLFCSLFLVYSFALFFLAELNILGLGFFMLLLSFLLFLSCYFFFLTLIWILFQVVVTVIVIVAEVVKDGTFEMRASNDFRLFHTAGVPVCSASVGFDYFGYLMWLLPYAPVRPYFQEVSL